MTEWLLAVVVVGSALAIGTVHVAALLVVSLLALVGATLEALALRRVPRPAMVLAGFGVFSALQAIPLPATLVSRLSPSTAEIWLRCLVPFGEPTLRHFPVSLDGGASVAEALKWVTYACIYVMATRMRARRGSVWLALLLFGTAVLVTLVTLAHGVADTVVLYGLYHPEFAVGRWNVGPLLNSNNLAGYAILGLFSGTGLVLSSRSPVPRLPLLAGLAVVVTALALSGSRAGVMSALLGGVVVLMWLAKSGGARLSAADLGLGATPLVVGFVFAVALGSARDAGNLASLDVRRKVSVWLWTWPMIRDHALFGVGRGAFESAFPPYRQALNYDWSVVVTHAENFVVQWEAEWGIVVGTAAVVAIVGYVAREWYDSKQDRLRFATMTGVVAVLLQNLADLGLEIPSVAIALVLAVAAGERPMAKLANEAPRRFNNRALVLSLPAFMLWLVALAWSRFPVEVERHQMATSYAELAIKNTQQRAAFRNRLHEAILRHPGESYFSLLGSLVAMRSREGDALSWIARALDLAPTNGPVHLALAELLHVHGATTQALLHLRLAAQYDRTLASAVSSRAPLWAPLVDQLIQAIPDGPYGDGILLEACAREPRVDTKVECFRRAVERSPRSPLAREHLAGALLHAIQEAQAPCNGAQLESCTAEAEAAARRASTLDPKAWRPSYLLAKLLVTRGNAADAAHVLTRTCPKTSEGEECWHEALAAALQAGPNDVISAAANGWAERPCEGMESCAHLFASIATVLESGGDLVLASTFFTKAADAEPSSARWLEVSGVASRAHLTGVALAALEKANRSFDASPASRAEVELLRDRLARATDAAR